MNAFPPRHDTPGWVGAILDRRATRPLARIALTLPYWWSGIDKALHPQATLAEVGALAGTATPLPFHIALLIVQLCGSLRVIFDRWTWLGAGTLGVFTLIAHAFWMHDGDACFAEMNTSMEHIALVAGFVFAAIASRRFDPNHR